MKDENCVVCICVVVGACGDLIDIVSRRFDKKDHEMGHWSVTKYATLYRLPR